MCPGEHVQQRNDAAHDVGRLLRVRLALLLGLRLLSFVGLIRALGALLAFLAIGVGQLTIIVLIRARGLCLFEQPAHLGESVCILPRCQVLGIDTSCKDGKKMSVNAMHN